MIYDVYKKFNMYYLVIIKNKSLLFVVRWVDQEISQAEIEKCYMFIFIVDIELIGLKGKESKKGKIKEEIQRRWIIGFKLQFGRRKKFCVLIEVELKDFLQ